MASMTALLFQLALLLLLKTTAGDAKKRQSNINVIHSGCQGTCGNYTIPYPFGIGPGCYRDERFKITCKQNNEGITMPFSGDISSTLCVFNFSLAQSQATMLKYIALSCYSNESGPPQQSLGDMDLSGTPFSISAARNKFTAMGCNTMAYIEGATISKYASGCMSFCSYLDNTTSGMCTGTGCCQTPLPETLTYYRPGFYQRPATDDRWTFNPCSYSFVADQDWFKFNVDYLIGFGDFANKYPDGVPLVLNWVVENTTCEKAKMNSSSYACRSNNSDCIFHSSTSGVLGYTCNCSQGYEGNPYLKEGCQDIDECSDPKQYPCQGICNNTVGGYTCSCKYGYKSEDPKTQKCTPVPNTNTDTNNNTQSLPMWAKLALGLGVSFILLLVVSFWACVMREKRKLAEDRERFFQQNGGLLLYEELRSRRESVTFKIYRKEELEMATNNFDNNLILGRGGHGTVYEGKLENGQIVAIKKSKTIDESQKEEFVKEILILSQINHNNVVKLLGCCLEVEVPMLVYEFVFNGTLYDYLHNTNRPRSISLDARLRIATESAEALAYLHSSASPPILHRDMKSSNILLDENYVAKVSDFGASILVAMDEDQLTTILQGTFGYLDPEYMQTYMFTEKSDVYGFGVVLVELLTRRKAVYFEGTDEEKNLASNFIALMKQGRLEECLDDQLMNEEHMEVLNEISNLAKQCLSIRGEERPTMKEVAEELQRLRKCTGHPWMQQNNEESMSLLRESPSYNGAGTSEFYCSLESRSVMDIESAR